MTSTAWRNMRQNRSNKAAGITLAAFLFAAGATAPLASQAGKPQAPPPAPPPVSDDRKQILRDRELLENLELLSNFEQIRYLEFFNDGKENNPSGKSPATKAAKKDEAGKNGKRKN
jgi:hypothetical protein